MSHKFMPDLCQNSQYPARYTPNLGGVGEGQALQKNCMAKPRKVQNGKTPFQVRCIPRNLQDGYLSVYSSAVCMLPRVTTWQRLVSEEICYSYYPSLSVLITALIVQLVFTKREIVTHIPLKLKEAVKGKPCTSKCYSTALEPVALWSPCPPAQSRLQGGNSNAYFT